MGWHDRFANSLPRFSLIDNDNPLCLLKTPKDRERLEIFAPPPYRRGDDRDSFRRRFHNRLSASSPRLLELELIALRHQVSVLQRQRPGSASAILHRPVQPRPIQLPSAGEIIAFPEVGGLHHRYERRAA